MPRQCCAHLRISRRRTLYPSLERQGDATKSLAYEPARVHCSEDAHTAASQEPRPQHPLGAPVWMLLEPCAMAFLRRVQGEMGFPCLCSTSKLHSATWRYVSDHVHFLSPTLLTYSQFPGMCCSCSSCL